MYISVGILVIVMNKPNNKKRKASQEKIKKVFFQLIQKYEIKEITVSDLCKLADINRSTFYANYIDIYDLAEKIKEEMFYNNLELFKDEAERRYHSYDYLKLFQHIKENQIYYKTMLKLKWDFTKYYDSHLEEDEAIKFYGTTKYMDYHISFFRAGINAIIKKWLDNDCRESPEEIAEILRAEYQNKMTIHL